MIYLDHNATTPMRPGVVEAMEPYWWKNAGNPASVHGAGRMALKGMDRARQQVADLVSVHPSQVVFVSGGTEANNLALFGQTGKHNFQGHVIISAIEHPSVMAPAMELKRRGMSVTIMEVDRNGRVDPMNLLGCLRDDTRLVSVMHANNETGVIQPIQDIANGCRAAGVPVHVDAVQTAGKLPLNFAELGVDMLSLSAHKLGGPKGVGALILNKSISLHPLVFGGGQERNRRSGTENLSGIVGFGAACMRVSRELMSEQKRLLSLRGELERGLKDTLPECVILGEGSRYRLPNTTGLLLPNMDGETLVMHLDLAGFAVSSGSACSSGRTEPSPVIRAMQVDPALAGSFIRISLGWTSTGEEVEKLLQALGRVVKKLQAMAFPP